MKFFQSFAVSFVAVIAFVFAASAQTSLTTDFQNVKVGNFGQMDDNFFRGAASARRL